MATTTKYVNNHEENVRHVEQANHSSNRQTIDLETKTKEKKRDTRTNNTNSQWVVLIAIALNSNIES